MVSVRFENGPKGIIGPTVGPFQFVQVTYDHLRDDNDTELAGKNSDGTWEGPDGEDYTDIVFM